MKRLNALWAASLVVIGVASIVLVGVGLVGTGLPAAATRALGVASLVAIFVLAFTTVKRIKSRG